MQSQEPKTPKEQANSAFNQRDGADIFEGLAEQQIFNLSEWMYL
jgi:hypothetical protein